MEFSFICSLFFLKCYGYRFTDIFRHFTSVIYFSYIFCNLIDNEISASMVKYGDNRIPFFSSDLYREDTSCYCQRAESTSFSLCSKCKSNVTLCILLRTLWIKLLYGYTHEHYNLNLKSRDDYYPFS